MCFMAQSNQFIRVIVEWVKIICESGYTLMRFQGKLPFLFWQCALFAPAPCPFEILAGALHQIFISLYLKAVIKNLVQIGTVASEKIRFEF